MTILWRRCNPAGNITAVVESPIVAEDRLRVSKAILDRGLAEQVGFAVESENDSIGRIQMMGGEFCGNAARAFGYLLAKERKETGTVTVPVEISGAPETVAVTVDMEGHAAYAEMPLPLDCISVTVEGKRYPLVRCPGIVHLVAEDTEPSEDFVAAALEALLPMQPEAAGVLFLRGETMTPAVYVRSTDSLVWESSCGSGSTACGYLRAQGQPDGQYNVIFRQPGGVIETQATVQNGLVTAITMGGPVTVSTPETLTL